MTSHTFALILDGFLLCGILIQAVRRNHLRKNGDSAPGEIIDIDERMSKNPGAGGVRSYSHPIIRFTTSDGEEIEARTRSSYKEKHFTRGTRVIVRYDLDRPENMEIETGDSILTETIITTCVVLILGIYGFLGFF